MLPWVLYNYWAAFYKWWAYSHFSSYPVNGIMVFFHWWQHSLDQEKTWENVGFLKNVVETWQQARLRQKARSCKGEATFLPRFPSACERRMKACSKAQVLWENNIAKVETQSLLRQNKYLIRCCLYLSHLKLRFLASLVSGSPQLAFDLHQKKPAKLPPACPSSIQSEHWVLCCDL